MAYTKQDWANGDSDTPLSAERLGHMEQGISDAHAAAAGIPTGTAQVLETGSNTQARLWSAKTIHDEIARQIAAAAE